MLRQGLILTTHREYAQAVRLGLLAMGNPETRIDVELDALRAMQLMPQQYDVILLDTMLDSMDGLQLLLLMKQQAPATKFIIVSDALDETTRSLAYQNGADFFLERPHTAEALQTAMEAIRGLLRRLLDSQPLANLEDSVIQNFADVVQTRCLSGDSVLLLVRSKSQSGDIFIYRGEVYHAQYPGKGGAAAFYDISHWDNGLVRVKALKLNHVPPRTIEIPYRQLLETATQTGALDDDFRPPMGELLGVSSEAPSAESASSVVQEAPPLTEDEPPTLFEGARPAELPPLGETPLPPVNSHWKVSLTGELLDGSQMAEPDRCAFITYFLYRKLADIAVALEVDYFSTMTLLGPHLQQVVVADNMGIRQAVFDASWATEEDRNQYIKWCSEQSF